MLGCSRFLGENDMYGRAVHHVGTKKKLFMNNTTAQEKLKSKYLAD